MLRSQLLYGVLPLLLVFSGCGEPEPSAIPAPDGPHHGWVVSLSDELVVELKNDPHVQKVELFVLAKDRKTLQPIADVPVLIVQTKSGERRLEQPTPGETVEGKTANYVFRDEALKADLVRGRVELTIDDKTLSAPFALEHVHERDH